MARKRWAFDSRDGELSKAEFAATQEVVNELCALAGREEAKSAYEVLEEAPGLYEGPTDAAAVRALAFEAAATFIWGAMYTFDASLRMTLLDIMSN